MEVLGRSFDSHRLKLSIINLTLLELQKDLPNGQEGIKKIGKVN